MFKFIKYLPVFLLTYSLTHLLTTVNACELLVLNRSDLSSESRWSKYDVVCVKDDGFQWGKEELNTKKFLVIKLSGVSINDVSEYLEAERDDKTGKPGRNRKIHLDIDKLDEKETADLQKNSLRTNLSKIKAIRKEKAKREKK